jgi:PKD repeat protein
MAYTTVDNTAFDALLAAVPAPFGPLTRTGTDTDLDTAPTVAPNSQIKYHVLSAAGVDVYISADELGDADVTLAICRDAHGESTVLLDLDGFSQAIATVFNALGDPLAIDHADYIPIFRAFQNLKELLGLIPSMEWTDAGDVADPVVADFTATPAALVVSFVNNGTEADATIWGWDFGDGNFDSDWTPGDHTYAAAGTYTITLYVFGPYGWTVDTQEVIVA